MKTRWSMRPASTSVAYTARNRSADISQRTCWLSVLVAAGLGSVFAGTALAVNMETVTVGNPGNVGELSGDGAGGSGPDRICGSVDYAYRIGKYEVTAGQYAAFLNAVAATDTYGLYSTSMDTAVESYGCNIKRAGSSGCYTYSVDPNWANRPVNYVSWGDAARFANWMHNGQPTGGQDLSTTEDGSYYLNGATSDAELMAVTRKPSATWAIPSEDEWYKAAYHKNDGVMAHYFHYPTSTDSCDPSMANYGWSVGHTTNAGSYGYPSPYGTFDQGGNIWEWHELLLYGSCRGVRGGSFADADQLYASIRDDCVESTLKAWVIGFRIAEVSAAPAIVTQPQNQTAWVGNAVIFTVVASGTEPRSYQWRRNGSDVSDGARISGATTATLLITPVAGADAGGYDVIVTNAYGAATSITATLTVRTRGDVNCDGAITYGDINPFVVALRSHSGYMAQYPNCDYYSADCNLDGWVDYGDINPFVQLLCGR